MPWIDIAFAVILVIFLLIGVFKGFWKTFVSLFSTLVLLIIGILLAKPLSGLLENWFGFISSIASSMQGGLESYFTTTDYHTGWIYGVLLVVMGKDYLMTDPDVHTLSVDFSVKLGTIIVVAICAIALLIIFKIILMIILKVSQVFNRNSIHRSLDRVFGGVLGVLKGGFFIFGICSLAFTIGSLIPPLADWLTTMFAENQFASTLYNWSVSILQDLILPFIFH